jgi:polysaccharide chain length determinant protein (PEP-CTERM system associated)
MNANLSEIIASYLRELVKYRVWFLLGYALVAIVSVATILMWPKSYTSYATIFADNSNILAPLLEGKASATSITDQSRMAREIMFKRDHFKEILEAAGYDVSTLSEAQIEDINQSIQNNTQVTNVGARPASLIRIAYSNQDRIKAFTVAQKYTSIFINESVVEKRKESKEAFDFIQGQVAATKKELQDAEQKLSEFNSQNNYGTMGDANGRISRYRTEIETLELELVQLTTAESAVEKQLSGEVQVVKNLNEMAGLRNRIRALQVEIDSLLSRYHPTYPDVALRQAQLDDLMAMYEVGDPGVLVDENELTKDGTTVLHQQLRAKLAEIKTDIQTKRSQLEGLRILMSSEDVRVGKINDAEAQRSELKRGYDTKLDWHNELLRRLENARISMELDEQQQGITFKVQEPAVMPVQPDGIPTAQLLLGSFVLALGVPLGILVLMMELDPRIRSESNFLEEWPALLMVIPPLAVSGAPVRSSNKALVWMVVVASVVGYGAAYIIGSM